MKPLKEMKVTQEYGKTTFAQAHKNDIYASTAGFHTGVDLRAPLRTPIFSILEGEVSFAGESSGWGKLIEVDHGNQIKSRYAHLDEFWVGKGQKVKEGEQIGFSGNSGVSQAAHLHFEIRYQEMWIHPLYWLEMFENLRRVEEKATDNLNQLSSCRTDNTEYGKALKRSAEEIRLKSEDLKLAQGKYAQEVVRNEELQKTVTDLSQEVGSLSGQLNDKLDLLTEKETEIAELEKKTRWNEALAFKIWGLTIGFLTEEVKGKNE